LFGPADVPADVEQPALRASLRADLLFVVDRVEAFVPDDGTARQAFAEVCFPDVARLVVDERIGLGHSPMLRSRLRSRLNG
jgi:hypothetical protein